MSAKTVKTTAVNENTAENEDIKTEENTSEETNQNASDSDTLNSPEIKPDSTPDNEKKPEENKPVKQYIYIGPALPGGALPSNKIFEGTDEEIEAALAEILEKYPTVKNLIVPTAKLAESKVKIKAANNILGKYYTELKKEFSKGGVNNGV